MSLKIGDIVTVPGGMTGTVRYHGPVDGKDGRFVGVELHSDFAGRGKNSGDVDGKQYFRTNIEGAGIFLPSGRATRHESPAFTRSPPTPTSPLYKYDLNNKTKPTNQTPPTPSLSRFNQSVGTGSRPNFSQSVGPGARAPSPQLKRPNGRPSLPRPESPLRKNQPSLHPSNSGRGSAHGFGSSVTGRPALSPRPSQTGAPKPQTPALGTSRPVSRTHSRQTDYSSDNPNGDTPTPAARPTNERRQSLPRKQTSDGQSSTGEALRLRRELEEKNKQLEEQATSLTAMESDLAELRSIMTAKMAAEGEGAPYGADPESGDLTIIPKLKQELYQKNETIKNLNEKIVSYRTDNDSFKNDLQSTLQVLEESHSYVEEKYKEYLARETLKLEEYYERKLDELERIHEQENLVRSDEVEQVATQLKVLEKMVAELDQGLEEARRAEAEAQSKVEFLEGEVERRRSELRGEKDKATKTAEQQQDEIRGLKAIIHSLSSGPDVASTQAPQRSSNLEREKFKSPRETPDKNIHEPFEHGNRGNEYTFNDQEHGAFADADAVAQDGISPQFPSQNRHHHTSSISSTKTAIRPGSRPTSSRAREGSFSSFFPKPLATTKKDSQTPTPSSDDPTGPIRPETPVKTSTAVRAGAVLSSPMNASENGSITSTVRCELCDMEGHDVLSCDSVGGSGPQGRASIESARKTLQQRQRNGTNETSVNGGVSATDASGSNGNASTGVSRVDELVGGKEQKNENHKEDEKENADPSPPFPATPTRTRDMLGRDSLASAGATPCVAGKTSKVIDKNLWCALCEREGHSSFDCPSDEF